MNKIVQYGILKDPNAAADDHLFLSDIIKGISDVKEVIFEETNYCYRF